MEKFKEIVKLCQVVKKIDFESGTSPSEDEIVLVNTEDQWFRAVCITLEEETKFMLIDFGTLADSDGPKNVKKIPKKLAEMPVFTNIVSVESKYKLNLKFLI